MAIQNGAVFDVGTHILSRVDTSFADVLARGGFGHDAVATQKEG